MHHLDSCQPTVNFPAGADSPDLPWHALHVRSNFERIVFSQLQEKGYTLFLPTYRVRRQWSDRVKQIDVPLFPGYVFCRLDAQYRIPIITTPGVVQIVGCGRQPVAISEDEIAAVRAVTNSTLPYMPWSEFTIGRPVVVESGPLMGVQGVLVSVKPPHRLVISVRILQRSVAVEIDSEWVRPLASMQFASETACQIS
jgi:transcription antitermination factor NusG